MKFPHLILAGWALATLANAFIGLQQASAASTTFTRTHPTEILKQLETRP